MVNLAPKAKAFNRKAQTDGCLPLTNQQLLSGIVPLHQHPDQLVAFLWVKV